MLNNQVVLLLKWRTQLVWRWQYSIRSRQNSSREVSISILVDMGLEGTAKTQTKSALSKEKHTRAVENSPVNIFGDKVCLASQQ